VQTGKLTVDLDNSDGRYDGWNADSPLYPNVTYDAEVVFVVRDLTAAIKYNIFRGIITDIRTSGYGNNARVTLEISDGWRYLRDYSARVAMQTNISPSAAIGLILDYIQWPPSWGRDLSPSTDTIKYFWANGNKIASSVIQEITDSFVGYFFIKANGQAAYRNRTDITASVYDYDQSELLRDIGLPQPYEIRRNVTRIKTYPRAIAPTGVIWQLAGDTPLIYPGASNSRTIFANYTYNDEPVPAQNVIVPVATTDYLVNTAADGSGTDLTANCTVSLYDFGDTAKLTITNNSGLNGYITKLQVRGDAVYLQNNADIVYEEEDRRPSREFFLDLLWQQNTNVAQDFSNLIGPFMNRLNPFPIVQIEARPEAQFKPDLFDIVSVSIPKLGILGNSFRVGGIEHHSVGDKCNAVKTTLYLESYVSFENLWTFPITNFGTDTVFGA
jgi:hypothetical protein